MAAASEYATETVAVVNCGQLVTMAGPPRPRAGAEMREIGVFEDGAMLVRGGRVAAVGPWREIRPLFDSKTATVVDAQGGVVTPGFVDAHTHLVFAGTREDEFERRVGGATYQEIAAAGGGILRTVEKTRAATPDELLAAARRHLQWCVRGGTTTLEAKSGYGLSLESEIKILETMRALVAETGARILPTVLAAHTVPREFAGRRDGYVALVVHEILTEVAARKLARFCDAFCDDHAFTVDETRAVLRAAKALGMGLRLHAEQFRPGTGAAVAAELGAATADHLECVDEAGIAALKAAGVQPVLLPASVFALGRTQYPPARRLVEAGLPVVLATDFNPGSSPTTSMPFVLSLASIAMGMLPAEAFTAATVNAAYSLGLGDEVGSLETGKAADFVIHEFHDYREIAYFLAVPERPRVFAGGRQVA